jgi:hypothetical protein
MMKIFLQIAFSLSLLMGCKDNKQSTFPEAMGDDEVNNLKKRDLWFEAMHRVAPGTNWHTIEAANAIAAVEIKKQRRLQNGSSAILETFAGGLLTGTWSERGATNIAGSNLAVDYDAPTNMIYTISAGGSLWRGPLTGNNWTLLNDDVQFSSRAIKVFNKLSGGRRLLMSKDDILYWSDDEGATITQSNGIFFPVPWGGNYIASMVVLNDPGQTIYVLTHNWDDVLGWAARHYLFRSTDGGLNFTRINIFTTGNDNEVSMVNPYNSNLLYVSDIRAIANRIDLYEVNGDVLTQVTSNTAIAGIGASPLAGVLLGNTLTLYILKNNNQLYKRVKTNTTWADWAPVNSTPTSSWNRLDVGIDDANKIYYGNINAYRSNNGGTNFTVVNDWSEYYSNIAGKLHADMMEMKHFKKTDNTIFQLINNHGGVAVSYDNMLTTLNLSLTGFNNSQSYDIITDTITPDRLFSGTQDQGMQVCTNTLTPGLLNFTQILSGDYGYLELTANNSRLWGVYPGTVYYWVDPGLPGSSFWSWSIPGTNIPNYGWMPPLKATTNAAANEVYIAGGNTSGSSGSYLIKLSATLNAPVTFTPTQFAYDFRANSNNGTSGISTMGVSSIDVGKLYIATEDGAFFYSNDNGANWNKTATFNGTTGWYLYGQAILASKLTSGLVWYGGSGYSNPGIFKSIDGGISFTAINNGLPQTLIHEIAANADESMLFAATDAGPYVYVVANNQWYPMIGASTPIQMYTAVEYIRSSNTVRFATHGRGIFDFKITTGPLPVTGLQLNATLQPDKNVLLNWNTITEIGNKYFTIEKSENGTAAFNTIATVNAYGNGNSSNSQTYQFTDASIAKGIQYYRIKQVDKNGKLQYSNIVKINGNKGVEITIAPNPVKNIFSLSPVTQIQQVKVFNSAGMHVKDYVPSVQYNISDLPAGIYILAVTTKNNEVQKIKIVKQ